MMKKLHKGQSNKKSIVESKEEQRRLLCSNKSVSRCSSLAFNPNQNYVSEDIALDYLASILVEIFLYTEQQNAHINTEQKSSDILPCINEGASGGR